MHNDTCHKKTKQIKTKQNNKKNTLLSMQSHIFTYHFHTNHVNELGNIFLFVIFWVDMYLYAPFSTSLNTLLHSSKAEKLLNSICPNVILFTSFALPSTDKFAEKMSNSPETCLSTFSIFLLRILVKHFWGKETARCPQYCVHYTFHFFSMIKICPFFCLVLFVPLFPPFLLLFLTYLFIITYSYT
jgi:hypothetical protein